MSADPDDLDSLIDAGEVAAILGLSHRNSVSTYRTRYDDFPDGRPAPGGGRGRLWTRAEVVAWHQRFRTQREEAADEPSERLDSLVAATTRLLLANPGREVSIREIAAEAGVAHSDLYRHADSKERLVELAVAQVEASIRDSMPADLDRLRDNLVPFIGAIRDSRAAMMVMVDRALRGLDPSSRQPLAVDALAGLLAERSRGGRSEVDPRMKAAAVGGLLWGLFVLEPRWCAALGLEEIDVEQTATIIRAVLDA